MNVHGEPYYDQSIQLRILKVLFLCGENVGKTRERKTPGQNPRFSITQTIQGNFQVFRTSMNPAASSRAVFIIFSQLGTYFLGNKNTLIKYCSVGYIVFAQR